MDAYTVPSDYETELQNKAKILAVKASDKHTFEFPECRHAFIEGFIEGFVERGAELAANLKAMGMSEEQIKIALNGQATQTQEPQTQKKSPPKQGGR